MTQLLQTLFNRGLIVDYVIADTGAAVKFGIDSEFVFFSAV